MPRELRHSQAHTAVGTAVLAIGALAFTGVALAQADPVAPAVESDAATTVQLKIANKLGASRAASAAPVTLNFLNAEIDAVARAMSVITGRQVVVDPRVKGTISLSSDKPLSPTAAYNQFLAALRLQGFTMVESSGLDKVVPEADGKLQSASVSAGAVVGSGSHIVTQIFKLNFENANNLLPVLRPLISPNNVINVNPGNNSLIITDYADNLHRIGRIIAANDVANGSDLEVLPLKHAIASDLAPLLLRLVDAGGSAASAPGQSDSALRTTIIAEPRSNSLIVRAANPARVALVKSLIAKLDQSSVQGNVGTGNIHVVYLKNADATKLATTLRSVLSGSAAPLASTSSGSAANAPTGGGSSSASASAASTPGQVQADVATNSLIITAPDPQYRQLREVIELLDARRAQVFVESLIVEVNASKAADFGVQWQGAIGNAGDRSIGILGTNFGSGGKNIISLAAGAASGGTLPSPGFNFGVANNYNGAYTLGFLARMLQQDADTNILSTPNLLTMDNEEAKIVVGQNVPFVTGQYTNNGSGSSNSVNPFQTIERKDVGITLKIKPQISESGTIKLSIFQEVSSVDSSSISSTGGLITNKRTIESNVLVEDGSIVVLGGLLQDNYQGSKDKVPGLGDVPFFGGLFRSESRSRSKVNLMVFLRPVVVRDAAGSEALAGQRYDQIRGLQRTMQITPNAAMPIQEVGVLPELVRPANQVPASKLPVVPPQGN